MESLDEEEARQYFVMTRGDFEASSGEDASDTDTERRAQVMGPGETFEDMELETEFKEFFHMLQQASEDGDIVSEADARQEFLNAREEWEEEQMSQDWAMDSDPAHVEEASNEDALSATSNEAPDEGVDSLPTMARGRQPTKKDFNEIMEELKEEWGGDGFEVDGGDWSEAGPDAEAGEDMRMDGFASGGQRPSTAALESAHSQRLPKQAKKRVMEASSDWQENPEMQESALSARSVESYLQTSESPPDELSDDAEIEELKLLLPGLPDRRLRRVRQAYIENLSDPSLVTLIPILRETMPVSETCLLCTLSTSLKFTIGLPLNYQDWYTITTIRAANLRNARFVMQKAADAGLVNVHLLNGMMQVYTSTGSLDNALALYDEFRRHNVVSL